jgi:hypothetical protein
MKVENQLEKLDSFVQPDEMLTVHTVNHRAGYTNCNISTFRFQFNVFDIKYKFYLLLDSLTNCMVDNTYAKISLE